MVPVFFSGEVGVVFGVLSHFRSHCSMASEDSFLFTSESVGEGHPGTKFELLPNVQTKSVIRFLMPFLMSAFARTPTAVSDAV